VKVSKYRVQYLKKSLVFGVEYGLPFYPELKREKLLKEPV